MSEYRIISGDNHVFEPPDLWTSRMEPKFRDKAPRLEYMEDGDWWYCGGHRLISLGPGAQTGKRFMEDGDWWYCGGHRLISLGPGAQTGQSRGAPGRDHFCRYDGKPTTWGLHPRGTRERHGC